MYDYRKRISIVEDAKDSTVEVVKINMAFACSHIATIPCKALCDGRAMAAEIVTRGSTAVHATALRQ